MKLSEMLGLGGVVFLGVIIILAITMELSGSDISWTSINYYNYDGPTTSRITTTAEKVNLVYTGIYPKHSGGRYMCINGTAVGATERTKMVNFTHTEYTWTASEYLQRRYNVTYATEGKYYRVINRELISEEIVGNRYDVESWRCKK